MRSIADIQIPQVQVALSGPLRILEQHIQQHQVSIEAWLRQQWLQTPAPINCSVDLRNAGFKLAPIDTNLFPAGFNNLNPDFLPLAIQAAQMTLCNNCPGAVRVLIIPENHTRNIFYFESLATLQEIIFKAGFEVKIGSLLPELTEPKNFELPSGRIIELNPIQRINDKVVIEGFEPCLILINNDFSDGVPEILKNISQRIRPPLHVGWSSRLKSQHFAFYDQVVNEFADLIDIDPWLINPLFNNCGEVDFKNGAGEDCLISNAEQLFAKIKRKYQEYDIQEKPFIVVKADAGTYGMGIMMIDSIEQLQNLNRKQRSNMIKSKGNTDIRKVILQEGVHTFETWGEHKYTAEPVVYMLGQHVIGGFYRVHSQRGMSENLNSPGMHFERLAFSQCCNNPCADEKSKHFYTYGVIARLALAAAARELVKKP
ncbi:MAG: glutamate--cysteine ligase [Legionellales bacterium]|nr:glutamate--cysteine ligase [Legionellales bacterium]